jgi:signal transduction histidine kinase
MAEDYDYCLEPLREDADFAFYRAFQGRIDAFPLGTGMGLRTSRSIIESHGGRLWAEGAPGQGAIFYLSLPAATPGHGGTAQDVASSG